MTYRVIIQRLAIRDLNCAYEWAAHRAPDAAARWLQRFQNALQTLADHPERCGHASERHKTDRDLRQLLFGRQPNVYRAVFLIDGDAVRVLSRYYSRSDAVLSRAFFREEEGQRGRGSSRTAP